MCLRRSVSFLLLFGILVATAGAHQATGFKLTEPSATGITVWTRITRDAERAADDRPLPITQIFDRATGECSAYATMPRTLMAAP